MTRKERVAKKTEDFIGQIVDVMKAATGNMRERTIAADAFLNKCIREKTFIINCGHEAGRRLSIIIDEVLNERKGK